MIFGEAMCRMDVEYGPVTMIVPASGHQVRCIPWVQMCTFNKEIGFLCGLKSFALNIFCGEYLQSSLHLMLQIWWKPLLWTGLLNYYLGKWYQLPYLVLPLISARVPLISTRVSTHCQAIQLINLAPWGMHSHVTACSLSLYERYVVMSISRVPTDCLIHQYIVWSLTPEFHRRQPIGLFYQKFRFIQTGIDFTGWLDLACLANDPGDEQLTDNSCNFGLFNWRRLLSFYVRSQYALN